MFKLSVAKSLCIQSPAEVSYFMGNKPWSLHHEAYVCDNLYREVTNSLSILEVDVPMEPEMEPETQTAAEHPC